MATVPPFVRSVVVAPALLGPTPRYHATPRWGLPGPPWVHPLDRSPARGVLVRARSLAAALCPVLIAATAAFVVAAGAQAWRYGLLVPGRGNAVEAATAALSDAVVVVATVLSLVLAVTSAVLAAQWLVEARCAAAVWAGLRDSRSRRAVLLGALLPGVNLLQAGVLVTELERILGVAAPSRLVRWWWAVSALGGLLAVVSVGWRAIGTAQARADAVVLVGITDLVVAAAMVLTLLVVRASTARLARDPATP